MTDPTPHIGFARAIARQMAGARRIDPDDLVGDALLGLCKAANSFDPERGVAFRTYATPRIRGEVLDGLRRGQWAPRKLRQRISAGEIEGRSVLPLEGGIDVADTADTEGAVLLRMGFAELPERVRRIVWAYGLDGLTLGEIAELEGVTAGRISQIVGQARRSLVA